MPLRDYAAEKQWRRIAKLLLEQGIFGVGLIDAELRITGVNDAICRITGYDREELVGRPMAELVQPDERTETLSAVRRVVRGELPSYSTELQGRGKHDREIWVKIAIWPLRNDRGEIDACLGVMEDVAEARLQRQRANQIEERIRAGMLAMTDSRDPREVLQAVVDLAREVAGARYAALGVLAEDGHELSDFLISGVDAETFAAIGHWPTGKGLLGAVTRSEQPIRLRDLTRYPVSAGFPPHHPAMRSFLGVPIEYKGRSLGNLYLANKIDAPDFTDEDAASLRAFSAQAAVVIENARMHHTERQLIQELNRTNRELEVAGKEKSVFLASMSHELRTPLHALIMAADILRDPAFPVTEERARGLSDAIATSGQHLLGLIDDLLEISRIETGRFEVRLEPTSLNLLLRECRRTAALWASQRRIHLDIPQIEGIWVEADPLRVRQALLNLLTNAMKFSDRGSRVWIEVRASDESVAIAVCDSGKGIAKEDLERIFRPFEQVGGTAGAGLGLAISRSIARAHGGTLEVTSEPGAGSRFEMALRRSHRVLRAAAAPPDRDPPAPAQASLLVVEDDPQALELELELLRSAGYSVIGASTVTEAMDRIARSRPDLVLLDLKLGGEDGLDVVRMLRRDPATRDIRVAASSAGTSRADVERAMDAGCVSFLAKPLGPRALLDGIRDCLEREAPT